MQTLYTVHWKNLETGEGGNGEPITYEEGKAWVLEMNLKYPHILHWLVKVKREQITKLGGYKQIGRADYLRRS